jgi:hypothetical protein
MECSGRNGAYIPDIPGGKVSILGDHSIGHSKQKVYMCKCSIPKGFRDKAVLLYSSKTVDKKEIRVLHTVYNTGIYYSSDKIGREYLI